VLDPGLIITIGHRTLRVEDYGKIAATFVDVKTGQAVRVAPRLDVRERAYTCVSEEPRHSCAQLKAYQMLPDHELVSIQRVQLTTPVEAIVSRAGLRVNCEICGEEIINEREVEHAAMRLCRSCAGHGCYQPLLETLA
jgi:formylmethanofuran dehydrogenase subunit E